MQDSPSSQLSIVERPQRRHPRTETLPIARCFGSMQRFQSRATLNLVRGPPNVDDCQCNERDGSVSVCNRVQGCAAPDQRSGPRHRFLYTQQGLAIEETILW
jgi:hypothetical protein